jgi:hypothetical protein
MNTIASNLIVNPTNLTIKIQFNCELDDLMMRFLCGLNQNGGLKLSI